MKTLSNITPSIRVAHHYRFWSGEHFSENRIGYCYAFHLFDKGKGKVRVGDSLYSVSKGMLLVVRPEELHSFYPDPSQPFSSYNMYCEIWKSPAQATHLHIAWSQAEYQADLVTPVWSCPELDRLPSVIPLQQHSLLQDLFSHMVKLHQIDQHKDGYSYSIVQSYLLGWITELCRSVYNTHHSDTRIQRIMERIEREPSLSYSELLEQSGMQKTQFHEVFKRTAGISPKAYILKMLMKQAAAELLESSRSVSEISDSLGFSSIHYFSKRFTEYYGISPTAFRQGLLRKHEAATLNVTSENNEDYRKK